jgi:hypothetical protein
MLFPWALLASVPSTVLGLKSPGQVPIRSGIVGGVGNKTVKAELLQSFATTPGKLRATENSGICGAHRCHRNSVEGARRLIYIFSPLCRDDEERLPGVGVR